MTEHQLATTKKRFLEAFSQHGVISRACQHVRTNRKATLDRSRHYKWLSEDPQYREAFIQADAAFTESLIGEAITRARDGKPKPIIWQGQLMGRWVDKAGKTVKEDDPKALKFIPLTVQEYSDVLLMFLIKAKRPEYRENHREALPPAADGAKSADEMFAQAEARAAAAQAPKALEEATIIEPEPEPDPDANGNGHRE